MNTHYKVSGGPMIVTFHSNTLFSSIKPAENPSTGFLHRSTKSINKKKSTVKSVKKKKQKKPKKARNRGWVINFSAAFAGGDFLEKRPLILYMIRARERRKERERPKWKGGKKDN